MGVHACGVCGVTFTSRNRLFEHLSDAGHFNDDDGDDGVDVGNKERWRCAEAFNAYYLMQNVAHSKEAWEACFEAFQRPMRPAVRFHTGVVGGDIVRDVLQKWLKPLPAGGMQLSAGYPRRIVAAAQELGILSRQEINSMIPPRLLDPDADHQVLDMCAAPGSKTLQLLDIMKGKSGKEGMIPGVLIANDTSRKRIVTAAQRSRKQGAAKRAALVLTACDASKMPAFKSYSLSLKGARKIRYQSILCDVPCSGDGTLRGTSRARWEKWNVRDGIGLHCKQLAILKRGLELLAPGGKLLYSTCSLNPLENEAVVQWARLYFASREKGRFEVAVKELPQSIGCQGLASWQVPHPDWNDEPSSFASFDQVPSQLCRKNGGKICKTLFPKGTAICPLEDLLKCRRMLPVHGGGGGFFCALLERPRKDTSYAGTCEATSVPASTAALRTKIEGVFRHPESVIVESMQKFWGLKPNFPFARVRVNSKGVVILASESAARLAEKDRRCSRIPIVEGGSCLFSNAQGIDQALYQEASQLFLKFATKRVVRAKSLRAFVEILEELLKEGAMRSADFEPRVASLDPLGGGKGAALLASPDTAFPAALVCRVDGTGAVEIGASRRYVEAMLLLCNIIN